jgi:hypothetical protein
MVHTVQTNWKDLNVNLQNLLQVMIQFFESKQFNNVTALQTEKGYQLIAGDSKHYKMENDVSVTIEGKPDDFTVTLTSCREDKNPPLPLILMSMFGGGYFLLKNFRSEEAMQKLERDFRERIGKMIEQTQEPNSRRKKDP